MTRLIELEGTDAKKYFLKGSSYFSGDFPDYISFEPILNAVSDILKDEPYLGLGKNPAHYSNVNYSFVANKDGRLGWRPFELIHPAIYVSLINVMCAPGNWQTIRKRFLEFEEGVVECCSSPVISVDIDSDKAAQVKSWWLNFEQRSIELSLEFSHVLHTDVTDCYGSLYTHSISWALHGLDFAKANKGNKKLLGNQIDSHIQAGRYGQTNGISQGSTLMDFIAEIVLGYVDEQISVVLQNEKDFCILRYRDDYRIFSNNDDDAERILKVISDQLRIVGMRLGTAKTNLNRNVIEGSIKADKLAAISLQDLGDTNARTIQKQLLRLHDFGRRFPNSGALRRLVAEFHEKITKMTKPAEDLEVQVAIACDIAVTSPLAFPAIAGVLSHLIALAPDTAKKSLWSKVLQKMQRVPYNGYLEIWLQRVTKPSAVGFEFASEEPICKIVNGDSEPLWQNDWVTSTKLKVALDTKSILVSAAEDAEELVDPEEIALFLQNARSY